MITSRLGGLVALALCAMTAVSHADGQTPSLQVGVMRVVQLRSGQRYIGILLEEVPGSHLRLRLPSGQTLTLVADSVAEVRLPRPEDQQLLNTPSEAEQQREAAPPEHVRRAPAAWVRAHLLDEGLSMESSEDSYAADKSEDEWKWSPVCDAPCGSWVSRQRYYRLRVPDSIPTRPFRMVWEGALREYATPPSELDVRYLNGRLELHRGGIALLILGPPLTVLGGAIPMIVGSIPPTHKDLLVGGGVAFGAGLLCTALGITFTVIGKNRVSVVPRPGTPGAPP